MCTHSLPYSDIIIVNSTPANVVVVVTSRERKRDRGLSPRKMSSEEFARSKSVAVLHARGTHSEVGYEIVSALSRQLTYVA